LVILKGEKFSLEGGGKVKKSFMHCRDIAEAIFAVLKDGKIGEIYNAGVDEPVSMRRLVEIVCKQLGKDFDKCVDITEGRIGEDKQYWLDSTKLYNDTGWKAKISLEDGIDETVNWVKENLNKFDNENLSFNLRA